MYIDTNTIIQGAAFFTSAGVIIGLAVKIIHWIDNQSKQDKEIKHIKKEQTLIYEGIIAILDGLEQQGCNHTVPTTRKKLIDHLNERTHSDEAD